MRPGRPSAWWDNFINGTMIEEEWRENFRMSKTSLLRLAEELRPYIEREETIMRSPVDIVKQVALTLHQSINLCPDDFRLPLVNQVKVCEKFRCRLLGRG